VEQCTDSIDIPRLNRIEEAGHGPGVTAIDFSLHGSPAGEAVVLGNSQER
jgi:hypothetical protein